MENKFINVNEAYEYNDIACWYQNSVDDTPPIWTDEHLEELLNDFYIIPKDTPTIDIVRCKDCIYWQEICEDPIFNFVWGQCKCPESPYRHEEDISSNDFCSYAYRREDND